MFTQAHGQLSRFLREEEAVSATEYAVLLSLIVLVSIAAIGGIGARVINLYNAIDTAIPDAGN